MHPITKDVIKKYFRWTPSKNIVRRHVVYNNFGLKRHDMLGASNKSYSFVPICNTMNIVVFKLDWKAGLGPLLVRGN